MSRKKSVRIGSSFSNYLKSDGSYEKTRTAALKRVLAWQREEAMRGAGMTKNEMAKRRRSLTPAR